MAIAFARFGRGLYPHATLPGVDYQGFANHWHDSLSAYVQSGIS